MLYTESSPDSSNDEWTYDYSDAGDDDSYNSSHSSEGMLNFGFLDLGTTDVVTMADVLRRMLNVSPGGVEEDNVDDDNVYDDIYIAVDTGRIVSNDYLKNMASMGECNESVLTEYIDDNLPLPYDPGSCYPGRIIIFDRILPVPGLSVPYFTTSPDEIDLLTQYLKKEPDLPVLCALGGDLESFEMNIRFGCTVHVKYGVHMQSENGDRLGVVMVCTQPCEAVQITHNFDRMVSGTVRIIGDHEQSEALLSSCTNNIKRKTDLILNYKKFSSIPSYGERLIQESAIQILRESNCCYKAMEDAAILSSLPRSTSALSYFLCNQLLVNYEDQIELFKCECAEDRIRMALSLSQGVIYVQCTCDNMLSALRCNNRMNIFGKESARGVFVNSYGVVFSLVTVQNLHGCIILGEPEKKDSWFTNYAWQIVVCDRCQTHLGWRFSTELDMEPKVFFALSEPSVVFS